MLFSPLLRRFTHIAAIVSAALLAAACGDDESATGGNGGAGGTPSQGGEATGGAPDGGNAQGGAGGEGTGGAPLDTTPIDAPPNEWTFVDFPSSQCMDGTPTGIGVNINPDSDNVVIFLMGGNACFNNASCLIVANPDGYDSAKFQNDVTELLSTNDYFDRSNPDNPFKDFSYVFVPYCTGDVHAGNKDDVQIGSKTYQFHGFTNMTQYLARLVPTFASAQKVVLTGVSAGGFGAAYNYDHVATAFGEGVDVTLIDDSGPPMAEAYVPECLQQYFEDTWGIDTTLPSDCTACQGASVWMEPYVSFILDKYPTRSLGLISSEGDQTIRSFWGYGENDCGNLNGLPPAYDPAKYKAGLEDLRDRIGADGRFRLFLVPGTEHVFVDNGLGAVTVDGVLLEDWMTQAIDNDPNWANVSQP